MSGSVRKEPVDAMVCRACGREERASEGYPCEQCGTFVCLICMFQGVTRCQACTASGPPPAPEIKE